MHSTSTGTGTWISSHENSLGLSTQHAATRGVVQACLLLRGRTGAWYQHAGTHLATVTVRRHHRHQLPVGVALHRGAMKEASSAAHPLCLLLMTMRMMKTKMTRFGLFVSL